MLPILYYSFSGVIVRSWAGNNTTKKPYSTKIMASNGLHLKIRWRFCWVTINCWGKPPFRCTYYKCHESCNRHGTCREGTGNAGPGDRSMGRLIPMVNQVDGETGEGGKGNSYPWWKNLPASVATLLRVDERCAILTHEASNIFFGNCIPGAPP